MGFLNWVDRALGIPETKNSTEVLTTRTVELPTYSAEEIRQELAINGNFGAVTALQISAVYACARVIAEGLAQVPCTLQRRTASGGHELAIDHPLFDLLNRAPNDWMTSFELREWIGFQLALTGNAYLFVARDTQGRAIELIPLAQGTVSISVPSFGEVAYRLHVTGQPTYTNANIWHIKGPSWNAVEGMSPQAVAARAIGLATDLETFGSKLFRNGARPSGLLTTDQVLSPEQQSQLQEAWNKQQSGVGNAHKTAVLSNGLKFEALQTTPDDAQWIESRRYQTEDICRIMRVNPVMIMQATDSSSYSSVEQFFLAHLTHTMQPWFERFTQSAEVNLLTRAEQRSGYRVHLDTRTMTLGDATSRATYYSTMRTIGVMTINECRDHEGLDRSSDPLADQLQPSANLFGMIGQAAPSSKPTA